MLSVGWDLKLPVTAGEGYYYYCCCYYFTSLKNSASASASESFPKQNVPHRVGEIYSQRAEIG